MNTHVDFEIAKLLKEKGFDKKCLGCFDERGIYGFTVMSIKKYYINSIEDTWNVAAPTIAEVVMWLYEKHGVWIVVDITIVDNWYFELYNLKHKRNAEIFIDNEEITESHNSPTEAYLEAISYTLKNLI